MPVIAERKSFMVFRVPDHHMSAQSGVFASSVLLPGDPLRARMISDTYLADAVLVNETRGLYAYTGYYKGKHISVMGSGMGGSATANIAWVLYNLYDVKTIIRVGTAGGLHDSINVGDIVIGLGSSHNTNHHAKYQLNGTLAALASYDLLERAVSTARTMHLPFYVGNIFCCNHFYLEHPEDRKGFAKHGCLASDQETAVLYMTASASRRKALTIDTISNHVYKVGRVMSAKERQESCRPMIELALEIA
jgi:purine-nucleoside phosphorylase